MTPARRFSLAAVVVLIAVALDQLSKEWALNRLSGGRTIELAPTLEFDLAYNSGFSFSAGTGRGNLVGTLVIALCGFIIWQIWRETERTRIVLLAAILGGALGNLTDRIFRGDDGALSGEVIDFIDVSWYAVFNVADMFVVCGCVAYVVHELLGHRRATGDDDQAQSPDGSDTPRSASHMSVDSTDISENPAPDSPGVPKT